MNSFDSGRDFAQALELSQQASSCSDHGITEHEMPSYLNLQDIDKSSNGSSFASPYQRDNGMSSYSSVRSQESACFDGEPGRETEDLMDLDPVIFEHSHGGTGQRVDSGPRSSAALLTVPASNNAQQTPPTKRKQPVIHYPGDCPHDTPRTDNQSLRSRTGKNSEPGPLAITAEATAEEVSQAMASDISKLQYHSKAELELVIRTSVLSLLSANKSRKPRPQDLSYRETTDPEKGLKCSHCYKIKKTQCDLKYVAINIPRLMLAEPRTAKTHMHSKHLKRHTRPYGCTYTNCPRRFGSKNDWKRHENTMHWQTEAWKCAEPRSTLKTNNSSQCASPGYSIPKDRVVNSRTKNQCGAIVHRREQFQNHLHTDHGLTGAHHEQYVKEQCKLRRIGRNGQRGFWCGFCQNVVPLERTGLEAWSERFDHIDDEHFKKGQSVDEWFPLDKEVPKGLLDVGMKIVGAGSGDGVEVDKGSDEEDSGSDADGEDVVVLGGGSRIEQKQGGRESGDAGSRRKEKSSQRWYCVSVYFSPRNFVGSCFVR